MKVFDTLLSLLQILLLGLLAGIYLNGFLTPEFFPWANVLSLTFPMLILLYTALCLFWLVRWKKRGFIFLFFILFFWSPISAWVNFNGKPNEKANLKVVSFNLKGGKFGQQKIYDYLKNTDADILLAQEYGSEFNVPGYPHATTKYEIVALNSKTEILSQGKIATIGNGNSFYADLKVNGKRIRVINLYLNPFSFEKAKVRPSGDIDRDQGKLRYVLKRLLPIFKIHQKEIQNVQDAIKTSPYPVLLAGDFNAVPFSYEYYTIKNNLDDAFLKVGNGSATSFHDYKFPLRIDYIFTSKAIKPVSYRVDRSVHLSDHFPVVAEFKID